MIAVGSSRYFFLYRLNKGGLAESFFSFRLFYVKIEEAREIERTNTPIKRNTICVV